MTVLFYFSDCKCDFSISSFRQYLMSYCFCSTECCNLNLFGLVELRKDWPRKC